jgi:RND family efflux transporter MFP subunit
MKPHHLYALAAAGAALLALAACAHTPASPPPPPVATGVSVEALQPTTVADEVEAMGTVAASDTANVNSRLMGNVRVVAVREGDHVRAGQLLCRIGAEDLAAQSAAADAAHAAGEAGREEAARGLSAAQAQADLANATYRRFQYLREQKSVAPQEFDEVESRRKAAEASLAAAQARVKQAESSLAASAAGARAAGVVAGYAQVTAPFAGVVSRRLVDPGTSVAPGTPLFVIESTGTFQMQATLDVSRAGTLKQGQEVRVALDVLPGKYFSGRITGLESGTDVTTHTVGLRISLPASVELRSGLSGRAYLANGQRTALSVPASALVPRGQLQGLYIVDGKEVARWRVVTVRPTGARFEVLSGLSAGERVVTNPQGRDLDGYRVEKP